jgi:predicted ATPase/class 3 adenylate cyclase
VETFTFLFTDIEGSTALLDRLGEGPYTQLLADHHALIRSGLAAHDGREVDSQGDGFFAVFSSPRACMAAVIEMQHAIAAHAWPAGEQVRVRMGVYTGEASKTAAGLVGLDVHRAARVAAVGYGGQVLLSETTAALVRGSLPPGAALRDLGVHRLKDLGPPVRIFQLDAAGLPVDFPPLRSLGNPALPNNLPAQLATFVGRYRELSQLRALVESCRLVTLTGAGGSGKTRLGLQLAAELLDGSGDGVWLVELAAVTDETAVAPAISRALGIAEAPGRPALDTLLDALAPQDILIVLDNCEHLIGACAKIADAIVARCPKVHLLATSREPLGIGGETIYRVPSLSLPGPGEAGPAAARSSDAVALFAARARTQGASLRVDEQTAPVAVSICRHLDGMPLAIELAAARLRSLSLTDLHDRLDQRFRLLTGGSRTALRRQQTLRATVEWSYSLLTEAERLLLRRLSVFAEGFELDAAEAVCGFGGIAAFDVTDLLGSLVDKSLVVAEPAGETMRYRLLETIRHFAAERLVEAGEDEAAAVTMAHCAHFLCLAETAAIHLTGLGQGQWLARLDAEQANLRRAADYATGRPDGTTRVLRFGVALGRYWEARSRDQEALGLLVPVLGRPDADADPGLFAAALATAGIAALECDRVVAIRLGEQGVELARRVGDERLLIESLATLCMAYYYAGESDRALALGQEAVQRARQFGDDLLLCRSLAGCLLPTSSLDPARYETLFTEAIACTGRSGDRLFRLYLYHNAGCHARDVVGDLAAARAHLEQAAQLAQAIGSSSHHPPVNLGWVLREEGDLDGARSRFEEGLRISRRNGDRSGLAEASVGLAFLASDLGDWHRAVVLHGAAHAFLDPTGGRWGIPEKKRMDNLNQLRARIGGEQFERVYAHGVGLSLEEAVDVALGKSPGPDVPVVTC